MTDNDKLLLESIGVDISDTLERFVGNEGLYYKCLGKFLTDQNFDLMLEGIREGDAKKAFDGIHAYKGICGNMGFSKLYKEVCEITEVFRAGRLDYDPGNFERLMEQKKKCSEVINSILVG